MVNKSLNDMFREENIETKESNLGNIGAHSLLGGIGIAGQGPVGMAADFLDAGLYAWEGDKGGAMTSLAAMVPFLGVAAGVKKGKVVKDAISKELDRVGAKGAQRTELRKIFEHINKINERSRRQQKAKRAKMDVQKQVDFAESDIMQSLAEYGDGKDPRAYYQILKMLGKIKRRQRN